MPRFRSHHRGEHFLESPEGKFLQLRKRRAERLYILLQDIEPQSKNAMPLETKLRLQRQLLDQLSELKRRAFQGPVALHLNFETTGKNPTHIHTIAKNLLDLFGKPLPGLRSRRRGLLYADDVQIHALAVSCNHGQEMPSIRIRAMPLGCLLKDIELTRKIAFERNQKRQYEQGEDALEEYFSLLKKRDSYAPLLSDKGVDALLSSFRISAQSEVLGRARLSAFELAQLYRTGPRIPGFDFSAQWEDMFKQNPFRIMLDELPLKEGSSDSYKGAIRSQLGSFKTKLKAVLDPLAVPVGLEIIVKPPPDSRRPVEHDLDNVARSYMIPATVDVLSPTSDRAFFFEGDEIKSPLRDDPTVYRKPPKGTRVGVMSYEVWRLPPAKDGEKGFVGLAVVADPDLERDVMSQIDDDVDEWAESVDDN